MLPSDSRHENLETTTMDPMAAGESGALKAKGLVAGGIRAAMPEDALMIVMGVDLLRLRWITAGREMIDMVQVINIMTCITNLINRKGEAMRALQVPRAIQMGDKGSAS
mmetsp:Transcript_49896/g.150016  ORF Transcript_49896/g.150016 Transcript_49896/m.150016 type:complete len:109 (+) Transcript_49896:1018-1344(+)